MNKVIVVSESAVARAKTPFGTAVAPSRAVICLVGHKQRSANAITAPVSLPALKPFTVK